MIPTASCITDVSNNLAWRCRVNTFDSAVVRCCRSTGNGHIGHSRFHSIIVATLNDKRFGHCNRIGRSIDYISDRLF